MLLVSDQREQEPRDQTTKDLYRGLLSPNTHQTPRDPQRAPKGFYQGILTKNQRGPVPRTKGGPLPRTKGLTKDHHLTPVVVTVVNESMLSHKGKFYHEVRHQMILKWIKTIYNPSDKFKVLDLGCSGGSLSVLVTSTFPNCHVTSIDGDPRVLHLRRLRTKQITPICDNIVLPTSNLESWKADLVIFCEVIEHFVLQERNKVLKFILQFLRPKNLVITTPNGEFNKFIPFLHDNGFRHVDHQIEYTQEEFKTQVVSEIEKCGYVVTFHDMYPGEQIQPSFVITAHLQSPGVTDPSYLSQLSSQRTSLFQPIWLSRNQKKIEKEKIKEGYKSWNFMKHSGRVPFLAPTIAPVDYSPGNGRILEHPQSAFSFYRARGITRVTCEEKYMGSRATVLVVQKSLDRVEIQFFSRGGMEFFPKKDLEIVQMFKREIQECLKKAHLDFVLLDGEMLPWAIKAGSLIEESFLSPGECALTCRKYFHGKESQGYVAAQRFLDTLEHYTKTTEPTYWVWNVLAAGNVKNSSFHTKVMGYYLNATQRYEWIKKFESPHVHCCKHVIVNLESPEECAAATECWLKDCASGGEGWVIKPERSLFVEDQDGKLILPCLKVRGSDYLRLIYGIDYLDNEEYFASVTKRNIHGKRTLSKLQHELSDNIIKTFLSGEPHLTLGFIAAFYGVDQSFKINPTF
eukprot:TRINITY_DN6014_c0_g1_i5.p1 TRINITY_DN6014_c0_g1~~TRINITY_DN6014_c0_g1_i5.p1  ORF type:complete len:685 (-),score=124.86 TRINITY_DN6014_c0_g1_i5:3-2057(-)